MKLYVLDNAGNKLTKINGDPITISVPAEQVDKPANLKIISSVSGSVVINFDGVKGVDHYDVYRSDVEGTIGPKINLAPIPQSAFPDYLTSYTDDLVNSVAPPTAPDVYYYVVVAVDLNNNVGLPSDYAIARVGYPQEITPEQVVILSVESAGN